MPQRNGAPEDVVSSLPPSQCTRMLVSELPTTGYEGAHTNVVFVRDADLPTFGQSGPAASQRRSTQGRSSSAAKAGSNTAEPSRSALPTMRRNRQGARNRERMLTREHKSSAVSHVAFFDNPTRNLAGYRPPLREKRAWPESGALPIWLHRKNDLLRPEKDENQD